MENIYKNFEQQYPVNKTLRFELKPLGETSEYIRNSNLLNEDKDRAGDFERVKGILDRYYKNYISNNLKNLKLEDLKAYAEEYLSVSRDKKKLDSLAEHLRNDVATCLSKSSEYSILFKEKVITSELEKMIQKENIDKSQKDADLEAIKKFQGFTTYFNGFFKNRENMFSAEPKATAISNRLITENLPRFLDNVQIYTSVKDIIDFEEIVQEVINDSGTKAMDFFSASTYTNFVCNEDIEKYNAVIGGKANIQGINEKINLYNQQHEKRQHIPRMSPLYKQILADRESVSDRFASFTSDTELLKAVNTELKRIAGIVEKDLSQLFSRIKDYDLDRIYIQNGSGLTKICQSQYGSWKIVSDCISKEYDELFPKKAKKKNDAYFDSVKKYKKREKSISVGRIDGLIKKYTTESSRIEQYFIDQVESTEGAVHQFLKVYNQNIECLKNYQGKGHGLQADKDMTGVIKTVMDSVASIEQMMRPLLVKDIALQKDQAFYTEFESIYASVEPAISLYNKVRNYLTKKPYSTEKIKLNFGNPQFLGGWSQSKERDYLSVMLRKDGLYYLGVMDKSSNTLFRGELPEDNTDNYEKMDYKLLPDPKKMLPKVFFAKSRIDDFHPSQDILEIKTKEKYKKSLSDMYKLVDFYKKALNEHEDWKNFHFNFSDTKQYKTINDFYAEVEQQGYILSFRKASREFINDAVKSGKLYLFQIYNKDFSPYATGNQNLHTLYWKAVFDEKNLKHVVYKLNGGAEVFFRKASIDPENRVVHPKNQPIKKKNALAESQDKVSLFPYDLVKDKRYTIDKMLFYVPITMNFGVSKKKINEQVIDTIRKKSDIYVIGIDRGERNLLYLSLIDFQGRIIKQQSLNVIHNDKGCNQDYHQLLERREKEMMDARRSWSTIESIKELKEGYLSQAIHIITEWMMSYPSIVVLEDLNSGFKNSRKKVDKQVYQKFEKMLIDKLNYLIDKNLPADVDGGIYHAYQLTDQFKNFQSMKKQSGFLFYIPAWNTSKIDPTTGFVDIIHFKYTSVDASKQMIQKFKSVSYDKADELFKITFDYKDFTDRVFGKRNEWTITSYGSRIENSRTPGSNKWKSEEINLTEEYKKFFDKMNIDFTRTDLKEQLLQQDSKDFYAVFFRLLRLTMQIRNSKTGTDVDYMVSPICNASGTYFDTRIGRAEWPLDADANGAFNIARKGLLVMDQIRQSTGYKIKTAISNQEWLSYAQEHTI